eukprot:scaffold743_cov117-Cylindrotheca_fusiformis.AAC.23
MKTRENYRGRQSGEERRALAPLERLDSRRGELGASASQPPFFYKSTGFSQTRKPVRTDSRDIQHRGQKEQPSADLRHERSHKSWVQDKFSHDSKHHTGLQQDNAQVAQFDLMDITIVIYGLSGILCEKETIKPKTTRKFGSSKDFMLGSESRSIDSKTWSGSTITSGDIAYTKDAIQHDYCLEETTTLVSLTTHTLFSDTAFETFLPSIPLHRPTTSGPRTKYTALWPAFLSDGVSENSWENSTFEIVRCMQASNTDDFTGSLGSKYVHETVELQLNLSRGTEMVHLGSASLVLSGEEEVEIRTNVPTKRAEHKNETSKHKLKKLGKGANKYGYFSDDLTSRFCLDENATLRIGVQVVSQAAKEMTIARERTREKLERERKIKEKKENRIKELRERMERVTMENTKRRLQMRKQIVFSQYDNEKEDTASHGNDENSLKRSQSFLPPSLLCGMPGMMCSPRPKNVAFSKESESQTSQDRSTLPDDTIHRNTQSAASTVSYTTNESESYSEWETTIDSLISDQGYSF